ncbi:hypothetical protein [Bernardetia sp.]|uniref:hypothetical protein n=1 Tax=Bernardetia sp. TaxID=1937974 RepID=UPI0025C14A4D|nr:hypothetical protein [Bernardetia sp.]
MNTPHNFYPRLLKRKHIFNYLLYFVVISFFSCADKNDSWDEMGSEKVLLAASNSSNMSKQHDFENALEDFLDIPSDHQLKKYIHPQFGFYINHKPSAISIVEHFNNLEEVYEQLPHLEAYFKKFNGQNPKNEEIPKFDCEMFSKEGTFYQSTSSFDEITKGLAMNEKIIEKVYTKEEKEFASKTDKKISHIVVLTDDYLEVGFAKLDGKWYMLWFNLAKFDCSA